MRRYISIVTDNHRRSIGSENCWRRPTVCGPTTVSTYHHPPELPHAWRSTRYLLCGQCRLSSFHVPSSSYIFPPPTFSPLASQPNPSSSPEIRRIFSTNNQTRTRHDYDRVRHAPSMIGSSIDIALSVNKRYIIFLFKRYTFYFTMTKYVFHARLIKRTLFHLERVVPLCSWNFF